MDVHLRAETEKKLKDLSALSGRATDELVEDAMVGYFAEVQQIAATASRPRRTADAFPNRA
jgi:hypothetical protein